jgi:hypothetical protein
MLIKAIHGCGVKFPEIAHSVVLLLMDFLGSDGASGVINFVREIVEMFPDLRESVLAKLIERFGDIEAAEVYRVALWILAEVCDLLDLGRVFPAPTPRLRNSTIALGRRYFRDVASKCSSECAPRPPPLSRPPAAPPLSCTFLCLFNISTAVLCLAPLAVHSTRTRATRCRRPWRASRTALGRCPLLRPWFGAPRPRMPRSPKV